MKRKMNCMLMLIMIAGNLRDMQMEARRICKKVIYNPLLKISRKCKLMLTIQR